MLSRYSTAYLHTHTDGAVHAATAARESVCYASAYETVSVKGLMRVEVSVQSHTHSHSAGAHARTFCPPSPRVRKTPAGMSLRHPTTPDCWQCPPTPRPIADAARVCVCVPATFPSRSLPRRLRRSFPAPAYHSSLAPSPPPRRWFFPPPPSRRSVCCCRGDSPGEIAPHTASARRRGGSGAGLVVDACLSGGKSFR